MKGIADTGFIVAFGNRGYLADFFSGLPRNKREVIPTLSPPRA